MSDMITFEDWNNGNVTIDPNEWFTPIFADRVIASTGERFMSSRVVGYKGMKSGIILGKWAENALEIN